MASRKSRSGASAEHDFTLAVRAANDLCEKALLQARSETCSTAWAAVSSGVNPAAKIDIVFQQLQNWSDLSVAAIREWYPKYLSLALAQTNIGPRDAPQWAAERILAGLRSSFGTKFGSVVWWFAAATQGRLLSSEEQNIHSPLERSWKPPGWLLQPKTEASALIVEVAARFAVRLQEVIDEEVKKAWLFIVSFQRKDKSAEKARLRSSSSGRPTSASSPFADDYRSVVFRAKQYQLTRNQAAMARVLHNAFVSHYPDVDKDKLLQAIESETSSVRDSWRKSALWKTLIVSKKKGTYRLNLTKE